MKHLRPSWDDHAYWHSLWKKRGGSWILWEILTCSLLSQRFQSFYVRGKQFTGVGLLSSAAPHLSLRGFLGDCSCLWVTHSPIDNSSKHISSPMTWMESFGLLMLSLPGGRYFFVSSGKVTQYLHSASSHCLPSGNSSLHMTRTPIIGTYPIAVWYQSLTNYSCTALFPNKVITQGTMGFRKGGWHNSTYNRHTLYKTYIFNYMAL